MIDKCELKDGYVTLKMKEKGTSLPHSVHLLFKTPKGEYKYDSRSGEYDDKHEHYYIDTWKMDKELVDKKDKEFWLSMYYDHSCYSRKIECKNKNLTPIGLDLDGSGSVEAVRGEFVIDITGDHFPETLDEWFAPTEGILVDTSYGLENGINGQHLFGDMGGTFKNGFEKMAQLDKNADSVLSGEELGNLALWVDANSNAKLDEGEIKSLESYGILNISTKHKYMKSHATLADGSAMVVQDLFFSLEEKAPVA